jgi:hypothetical protein
MEVQQAFATERTVLLHKPSQTLSIFLGLRLVSELTEPISKLDKMLLSMVD